MADISSPDPASPHPAGGPLTRRSEAASAEELTRAHRLLIGSEGAYWERNLVSGEFWYSPNFFSVTGIEPTTDRAQVHACIHPDDLPAFDAAYRAAVARVGVLDHDLRYLTRDGSYRWARLQGRVWPDELGRAAHIVGMVGDIHEERLARQELLQHRERLQQMVEERTARLEAALAEAERQRAQAEQANEAKSIFLAHMSHEIRTPLHGVLGLNELALREAHSSQQRRYLKLALQSGRGLLEMLNGVLDFSRLNAGAAPSSREAFDLAEVLATSVRQVMPMAREKHLGVMFDYLGEVTRVVGDAQRLQQIATNLLTNAVKYTDQGHIALTARVRPVDAEPGGPADGRPCRVDIDFSDTGLGMPPEVAVRVFEPFVQGDESLARQHGGSGLGLSIARGLAVSMGGQLTLDTAPGQGACFHLQLELQQEPGGAGLAARPDPGHAWLVYTQPVPAQWLATRLLRQGWTSEVIENPEAALVMALAPQAPAPDLVVMAEAALVDSATLPALRRALPTTPITLLVRPDWNQPEFEAAARAANLQLTFMPVTPTALLELLTQREPLPGPLPDSAFGELEPALDASADVLIAEDNPVNQLIITEMVAVLGLRARVADDGAMAIAACLEQPPRLVLMDLQMPRIDGMEATRQLLEMQHRGALPDFPIIALTAHATPQDHEQCLAAGMQGFLTKPISLEMLRSALRRWVPE